MCGDIQISPFFTKTLFVTQIRLVFYIALLVLNLDYVGGNKLLESIQRIWTKQIDGFTELSYDQIPEKFNCTSKG